MIVFNFTAGGYTPPNRTALLFDFGTVGAVKGFFLVL